MAYPTQEEWYRPAPTESDLYIPFGEGDITPEEYIEKRREEWGQPPPTAGAPTAEELEEHQIGAEPTIYGPTTGMPTGDIPTTGLEAYTPYPAEPTAGPTGPVAPTTGLRTVYSARRQPTGTISTTTYAYPGVAPEAPEVGAFAAPPWRESEIRRLTQMKAGPGLRRLRREAQRVAGQYFENPNVKRMTVREALAGMGIGMGSILTGAGGAAAQEYGMQYGREYGAALTSYQAQTNAAMAAYQAAWQAYLAEREATTVMEYTYDEEEGW